MASNALTFHFATFIFKVSRMLLSIKINNFDMFIDDGILRKTFIIKTFQAFTKQQELNDLWPKLQQWSVDII